MIFCKGKKYIFSKDVYLASDERVEKLNDNQIDQYDGLEVQVAHSYLGYINNSRISSFVPTPRALINTVIGTFLVLSTRT